MQFSGEMPGKSVAFERKVRKQLQLLQHSAACNHRQQLQGCYDVQVLLAQRALSLRDSVLAKEATDLLPTHASKRGQILRPTPSAGTTTRLAILPVNSSSLRLV